MNGHSVSLDAIGRLPAPDDNVAIATRRLEVGTSIKLTDALCVLAHTVLEGHRFAIRPIAAGQRFKVKSSTDLHGRKQQ